MKAQAKARDVRPVQSPHPHNGQKIDESLRDDWHTRIAVLAYSFYERRGREDGHDVDDWIQAEKTICDAIASKKKRTRAGSKS